MRVKAWRLSTNMRAQSFSSLVLFKLVARLLMLSVMLFRRFFIPGELGDSGASSMPDKGAE